MLGAVWSGVVGPAAAAVRGFWATARWHCPHGMLPAPCLERRRHERADRHVQVSRRRFRVGAHPCSPPVPHVQPPPMPGASECCGWGWLVDRLPHAHARSTPLPAAPPAAASPTRCSAASTSRASGCGASGPGWGVWCGGGVPCALPMARISPAAPGCRPACADATSSHHAPACPHLTPPPHAPPRPPQLVPYMAGLPPAERERVMATVLQLLADKVIVPFSGGWGVHVGAKGRHLGAWLPALAVEVAWVACCHLPTASAPGRPPHAAPRPHPLPVALCCRSCCAGSQRIPQARSGCPGCLPCRRAVPSGGRGGGRQGLQGRCPRRQGAAGGLTGAAGRWARRKCAARPGVGGRWRGHQRPPLHYGINHL